MSALAMDALGVQLTAEQAAIAESIASAATDAFPLQRVQAIAEGAANVDRGLWSQWAELGWFGLGIPEDAGGVGCGLPEEVLLFREVARRLVPGPVLATVLAVRAALGCSEPDLAAELMAGDKIAGLGLPTDAGAVVAPDITGRFMVLDPGELVLVACGDAAAIIETASVSEIKTVACVDETVRMFEIECAGVRPLLVVDDARELIARARLLVAAGLSGIATETLQMSVEYVSVREQFGRPIGSFQAVKHRCAEMARKAAAATALVHFSAAEAQEQITRLPMLGAAAQLVATDAGVRNAHDNVQNHGGIAITFEHPAHHYLKRASVLGHMLDIGPSLASEVLAGSAVDN